MNNFLHNLIMKHNMENGYIDDERQSVFNKFHDGYSIKQLAEMYNTDEYEIEQILRNKN